MGPKFPAIGQTKIDGNDSRHNKVDSNRGGSPIGGKSGFIPPAKRGGFGQHGQRRTVTAPMGGGRSGSGNPASRGGNSIGAMRPHTNIPGHGGSPQMSDGQGSGANFGDPGQANVPGGQPTNGPAGAGNTSGRSYQLIAGRFKRAAMGAKASSGGGKYGAPPVSSNT